MKYGTRTLLVFILPGTLFLFAIALYPMVVAIRTSLFDLNWIVGGGEFVGLANYASLATDARLYGSIGRSCLHAGVSVFFHFLVGLGLALLLNRRIAGRGLFRGLLVVPWLLTPVVAATTWVLLYDPSLGLVRYLGALGVRSPLGNPNTSLMAISVTYIWKAFPLHMVMYLAGLQAIPHELYEAAMMDGSGGFRTFLSITLPYLKGIILTVFLLDTIWTFRLFDFHYLMTEGGPMHSSEIIPLYMYKVGFERFQIGRAAAIGVVMFAILALICVFYLKYGFEEELAR